LRGTYWSNELTSEFFLSPRIQYQFRPKWRKPVRFNASIGAYNQAPFYRELRDIQGEIQGDVISQKSVHFIAGVDRFFTFWNRPFLLSTQFYYKYLYDLNTFEIDNVRLRYFADNNSTGYSTGFDIRLNGEFITGTQSWFSLGYLKSNEFIPGDERADVRRPLDQRLNLGVYFEDYMKFDETLRIYVNLVFGSGYPVGPPQSPALRNVFSGDEYYRTDVGLSKGFFLNNSWINSISARVEVLNALGADNTLSYTWIQDITGTSFAIPNSLSARFFNVKLIVKI
jgi:hypothetical protein